MKPAVIDTSFILSCIKNKIDFFEEIRFMGFEVFVPKQVVNELERLIKTKKGATKTQADLALKILKANRPKLIDFKKNYVDKGIIKYANTHPSCVIATLDSELKKKIKNPKIIIRGKKKLEIQ